MYGNYQSTSCVSKKSQSKEEGWINQDAASSFTLVDDVASWTSLSDDEIKKIVTQAFLSLDDRLRSESIPGGCTATVTLQVPDGEGNIRLVNANLGDSPTFYLTPAENGLTDIDFQSVDLDVSNEEEMARIKQFEKKSGRKCIHFIQEYREYGISLIGLEPTRTFGDFCAKSDGVIAEPVITIKSVSSDHPLFVLQASDGIYVTDEKHQLRNEKTIEKWQFNSLGETSEKILTNFVDTAMQDGSSQVDYTDDTTVMLIPCQTVKK